MAFLSYDVEETGEEEKEEEPAATAAMMPNSVIYGGHSVLPVGREERGSVPVVDLTFECPQQ